MNSTFFAERNYWNNTGRYQGLANQLQALIPDSGSVNQPRKNRALEAFRVAVNAYYDIFNNGGGNRRSTVRKYFGPYVMFYTRQRRWDDVHRLTEQPMDAIILAAAREQGLMPVETTTGDCI